MNIEATPGQLFVAEMIAKRVYALRDEWAPTEKAIEVIAYAIAAEVLAANASLRNQLNLALSAVEAWGKFSDIRARLMAETIEQISAKSLEDLAKQNAEIDAVISTAEALIKPLRSSKVNHV